VSPGTLLNYLFNCYRDLFGYQWWIMRKMQVIAEQHLQSVFPRWQRNFGAAAAISEVYMVLIGRDG